MSDRSVEALPPAETDPPAPIDETAGPAVVDPDDDHPGRRGLRGRIGSIGWRYTLVVFAVEVAFFSITAGALFLTRTNLILTAQNVAVLTVVACGSTFVLITAGVDLSVGSVAILGEVLAAKTIIAMGGSGVVDACLGVAAGVAVGVLVGIFNGIGVAYLKVPPLIVTLSTLLIGLSAAQIITGGVNVPNRTLNTLGNGRIGGIPYLVLVALGVVVVTAVLLHFTVFGRYTYAVGSNAEAARRVGINVDRHLLKVYALAGSLSGFGGVLSLARFNTTSIGGHTERSAGGDHRRRARRHQRVRRGRHDHRHDDRRLDPRRAAQWHHHPRRRRPTGRASSSASCWSPPCGSTSTAAGPPPAEPAATSAAADEPRSDTRILAFQPNQPSQGGTHEQVHTQPAVTVGTFSSAVGHAGRGDRAGGVGTGGEHRRRREHRADCAEPAGRHRSRGNGRSGHRARRLAAGRRHRHLVHPGRERRRVLHLDGMRRAGRRGRVRGDRQRAGARPPSTPRCRTRSSTPSSPASPTRSSSRRTTSRPRPARCSAPRTPASRSSSSTPRSTTPRSARRASPRTTSRAAWRRPMRSPT